MEYEFNLILLAGGGFIATNLDNFILLIALFAHHQTQKASLVTGYAIAMAVVLGIALMVGKAASFLPVTYIGFLGIIPILMGIYHLYCLFDLRKDLSSKPETTESSSTSFGVLLTVLSMQLSNSTDTVVAFSILFADSSTLADFIICLSYFVAAAIFILVARIAASHSVLSDSVSRYGNFLTPFIMIAIGSYVLANTATDLLPG